MKIKLLQPYKEHPASTVLDVPFYTVQAIIAQDIQFEAIDESRNLTVDALTAHGTVDAPVVEEPVAVAPVVVSLDAEEDSDPFNFEEAPAEPAVPAMTVKAVCSSKPPVKSQKKRRR